MPNQTHSKKQKRQAKHVADSERKRGVDPKRAESIGWATVNKLGKSPAMPSGDDINENAAGPVPSVFQPPKTSSPAPITRQTGGNRYTASAPVGTPGRTIQQTAGPRTERVVDQPKESDMPPMPKQQSVKPPAAPSAPPMVAQNSTMGPKNSMRMGKAVPMSLDEQFHAMTEKLKRRAHGAGKRASRRAQRAAFGKGGEVLLPGASPARSRPSVPTSLRKLSIGKLVERKKQGITHLPSRDLVAKKSLQVMSISEYYDSIVKADAPAPGAPLPKPKKFPRKEAMKPVSDQDAAANLKAGKRTEKSLMIQLAAIKALAAGYSKVSGGGALRAPNRGSLTVADLNRAMEVMPKPAGVKPPSTYLPGVHDPKSPMRKQKNKKPMIAAKGDEAQRISDRYVREMADAEKALAAQLGESTVDDGWEPVVHKSEGDAPMAKMNFNDLFKSELGTANDEVLVDCPHCEAPITKSDISKASVAKQNASGKTMHGGDGKGQVASKRTVPGAQKTDAVVGVQNSKGSKTHKSETDDDASSDGGGDDKSMSPGGQMPPLTKGIVGVRGTDFVQYVDYGDAPGSDAAIAKSIAQGQVGQQPTQPMDLNNDLSRLLV